MSYFEDEFESGDYSAWPDTTMRPACEIGVVNTRPFKGIYSSRSQCHNDPMVSYAMCYHSWFAIYSPLYYRNYIWFNKLPSNVGEQFGFIDIYLTNNNDMLSAGLSFQAGQPQWWLYYRNGVMVSAYSPTPTPIPNKWYCIEIMNIRDAVNGEAHLWIDEQEVIAVTGINSASIVNSRVGSGLFYVSPLLDITAFIDSCIAAGAYIGPETGLGRFPQYQTPHAAL